MARHHAGLPARLLNCFATRASNPIPAMLKNGRPAISAGIDRSRPAVERDGEGGAGIARHTERCGEAVAGTGADERHRRIRVQHARAGFVHRAVTAPDDDQLRTRGSARGREMVRVAGALGHVDLRAQSASLDLAAHERDSARTGGAGSAPAPEIGLMMATIDMNFGRRRAREPCYSNFQHRVVEVA